MNASTSQRPGTYRWRNTEMGRRSMSIRRSLPERRGDWHRKSASNHEIQAAFPGRSRCNRVVTIVRLPPMKAVLIRALLAATLSLSFGSVARAGDPPSDVKSTIKEDAKTTGHAVSHSAKTVGHAVA